MSKGKMISQARIGRKDKNDSFSGRVSVQGNSLPGVTSQFVPVKGSPGHRNASGRARRERRLMDAMTKLNGRVGRPASLNVTDPHPLRTLRVEASTALEDWKASRQP